MKKRLSYLFGTVLLLVAVTGFSLQEEEQPVKEEFTLVIHGGAGNIPKDRMPPEMKKKYFAGMEKALQVGREILLNNGKATDAVEAVIKTMEDNPIFNAGKGAVFNKNGENELDASFMDGKTRNAGSVAGVKRIKNPISAARKVMEKSPHVMLYGDGAEDFAAENGLEIVAPDYFYDADRFRKWQEIQNTDTQEGGDNLEVPENTDGYPFDAKFGTVGCVAMDKFENIAAGTSTGGMTNKAFNRIGDSPIVGSGTYADNEYCGVSCTGHGEYFMRVNGAHTVYSQMKYGGEGLADAVMLTIEEIGELGGEGGIIAIDEAGDIFWWYNTQGMWRGTIDQGGETELYFYE